MSAKIVVSASLSSSYDKRYVVVDDATGEVLDDAQGYGYKTAQNADRAHAYKSMSPKKKRQRDAAKRRVQRWSGQHPDVVQHLEQVTFYAMKDGENVTAARCAGDLGRAWPRIAVPGRRHLMKHW